MCNREPTSDSGSPSRDRIGYATCAGCGQKLTPDEQFNGVACDRCDSDFLVQDEDEYPYAA